MSCEITELDVCPVVETNTKEDVVGSGISGVADVDTVSNVSVVGMLVTTTLDSDVEVDDNDATTVEATVPIVRVNDAPSVTELEIRIEEVCRVSSGGTELEIVDRTSVIRDEETISDVVVEDKPDTGVGVADKVSSVRVWSPDNEAKELLMSVDPMIDEVVDDSVVALCDRLGVGVIDGSDDDCPVTELTAELTTELTAEDSTVLVIASIEEEEEEVEEEEEEEEREEISWCILELLASELDSTKEEVGATDEDGSGVITIDGVLIVVEV
jgi:hypothetical protein